MTKQIRIVEQRDTATQFEGYTIWATERWIAREPFTFTITWLTGETQTVDGDFDANGKFILSGSTTGFTLNAGQMRMRPMSRGMHIDIYPDRAVVDITDDELLSVVANDIKVAKKTTDLSVLDLAIERIEDRELANIKINAKEIERVMKRIEKAREIIQRKLERTK